MHQSSFYTGVRFMLLLLFAIIVQGQTTTLPEAQEYTDGLFTDPIKLTLLGLQLTRSSIFHTTEEFYVWIVDDHGNNSLPFTFHAVNATGTEEQRALGGFWSGQFWLRDTPATTSTASSLASQTTSEHTSNITSTAAVTSETSSSASPTTSASPTSSSSSSSSPSSSSSSSSSSTSGSVSTTSLVSPASTMIESPSTSSTATTSPSGSSGSSKVVIGVGVGIGVGVAALLIGAFVLWRRHHNRSKKQKAEERSNYLADSSGDRKSERSSQTDQRPRAPHLPSYELAEQPRRSPVEAYDRWQEPRELSGSPFRR
ncbi:hypothetical protein M438DRAFT_398151 [Aureobasidium pullulans EXF-150]|uniref:Mid2 domain-containing protein n=1 Tax=Aureobasidium pullulans EXF-150 TaxID=1043002 RepID=A0A074XMF3_AURPU|nr:uncharacterized protein M438DRAFT_398151 [Aureobasidium pullulans EXF-150]KEQ83182.1 hypothetical protein M438DRAFT_398151 [Aureobasidium pullulans EXF-150]THY90778.1 hypothetical protein D6C93_06470 [Aureobasidium pullulans]